MSLLHDAWDLGRKTLRLGTYNYLKSHHTLVWPVILRSAQGRVGRWWLVSAITQHFVCQAFPGARP